MKLLSKILIFFLICFGCNIISIYLPFPFPGSVLSMIVLFLCLTFGAIKLKHIDDVADFFHQKMRKLLAAAYSSGNKVCFGFIGRKDSISLTG